MTWPRLFILLFILWFGLWPPWSLVRILVALAALWFCGLFWPRPEPGKPYWSNLFRPH